MSTQTASACGKIILSGEYAVLFGYPGLALPSKERITVTWVDDPKQKTPAIVWKNIETHRAWDTYVEEILKELAPRTKDLHGTLEISSDIPLGKGMGSSTALIIAMCRCFLGPTCGKMARSIEDVMNPGHSGIDFAVIMEEAPILYKKNEMPAMISLPANLLNNCRLIDTGTPNEPTKELVAWVKSREGELKDALSVIGGCADRILKGEDLKTVLRDHHRAQVKLGVVPEAAQAVINAAEGSGGAAKVIGAGGRTGGGGMVLVLA